MQEIIKQAVQYFKENKAYERFFIKMKEKLETYEKEMSGTVILENPTKEEKELLTGFMKKDYKKNKTIQIKIGKFQKRLEETRFSGIKVKELVQEYFGGEIITKKQKRKIKQEKLNKFFNEILQEQKPSRAYSILKSILEEKKENYSFLKMEYNANKQLTRKSIEGACKAINNLPKDKLPLPVFSARILKNPHELDKTNLTGKIFIIFLCKEQKVQKPKSTEQLSEFYYNYNLLIDDLSNMVLCKNIIGKINEETHPGWLGFMKRDEAIQITLAQLSKIDKVEAKSYYAIVVENPAVFSILCQSTKEIPLVCTYGQVKLSGIILLNLLVDNGVKLYYSGDLDPEGVQIADKLKRRYKEKIELIGFDTETYYKNISNVKLNTKRLKKLEKIETKELIEISKAIALEQRAAYEEKNLENIILMNIK